MHQLDHIVDTLSRTGIGLSLVKCVTACPVLVKVLRERDILSRPRDAFNNIDPDHGIVLEVEFLTLVSTRLAYNISLLQSTPCLFLPITY